MQSQLMPVSKFLISALIVIYLGACASAPKAHLDANATPEAEISRLVSAVQHGYLDHLDVTSQSDFDHAREKLEKAKRQLADKEKNEVVLNTLSESRGYLNRAIATSMDIVPKAQGILDARNAALVAGARNFPNESAGLKMADDDFRSEASRLQAGKLNPRRWSELQAEYLNVEIRTIQNVKLADPQARVLNAINAGARSYAPHVLKRAEWDLQNARNIIATDRHSSIAIMPAVLRSQISAVLLTEVLKATHAGRVEERAAVQMVKYSRNIAALRSDLSDKTSEISAADQQLREQQAAISLDQALNHARKQFKSNEAEVYRQGDKLLIRLKGANFNVGEAAINSSSVALMHKAQTITANLRPQQVVIEGNTDSSRAETANAALAQERAESVAKFFEVKGLDKNKIETVGLGAQKPLASNRTMTGRAQNRRVDIIVTPSIISEAAAKSTDVAL